MPTDQSEASHPLRQDEVRLRRRLRGRIYITAGFAVAALLGLMMQIANLQIVQHSHYATLSKENRIRVRPVPPSRGLIRDRNGAVLARNLLVFSLEIVPEEVGGIEDTLTRLRELLPIGEQEVRKFRREMQHRAAFERIALATRLTDREIAVFSVNRHRFPGVDVYPRSVREYPYGEALAHLVGYVGRIDSLEHRRLAADPDYRGARYIGKTGVEHEWEAALHGYAGMEHVEVDAKGRTVRLVESTEPVPGSDLYLNIDVDLQLLAHSLLADRAGAIVALDPRQGEVLAFASSPAFDPNLFAQGMSASEFARLNSARDRPLFNRALHGQYSPGSVVKPFIGLAGLEQARNFSRGMVMCAGSYRFPGSDYEFRDWKKGGHGLVDLEGAIAESCDVYFYLLADQLGIARIHRAMTAFGFGRPTGVDLPREASGLIPSRAWKRATHHRRWTRGETVITGIGQGYMLATPLQLAAGAAALAGRGVRYRPRAVGRVAAPGGDDVVPAEKLPPVIVPRARYWRRILDGMESVVHGPRGSARRVGHGLRYRMAGKTGTVQVVSKPRDEKEEAKEVPWEQRDHALFVGFPPLETPRIAVAVVIEHGGSGGQTAAPIARAVIDRHLSGGTFTPGGRLALETR